MGSNPSSAPESFSDIEQGPLPLSQFFCLLWGGEFVRPDDL